MVKSKSLPANLGVRLIDEHEAAPSPANPLLRLLTEDEKPEVIGEILQAMVALRDEAEFGKDRELEESLWESIEAGLDKLAWGVSDDGEVT